LPTSVAESGELATAIREKPDVARRTNRAGWLAVALYDRIKEKLTREPVEDFRIDFEDGYGNRPDVEEDGHAEQAAVEVAQGMVEKVLPPFIGIRIKPLSAELRARSIRTLDVFLSTLLAKSGGKLPENFVVTLPKVNMPEQVAALRGLFGAFESRSGLNGGPLRMELMIEQTQAIFGPDGHVSIPQLIEAGEGRVVAAHFGTYDYTASCNITAAHQSMTHPACDFAKHVMQVTLSGTGVWMSDGATTVMPIGPHAQAKDGPPLTAKQIAENMDVVHRAWKLHFDQATHSLIGGFYQGWDLHPAQLITRYAAVYSFFLGGLDPASERLRNFVERAAQATLVGDIFDDAATGQGLLNFFLRAQNSGAITEEEATRLSGLSVDELRSRSFVKILNGRRQK
jgi:citrate lyase beta subunit